MKNEFGSSYQENYVQIKSDMSTITVLFVLQHNTKNLNRENYTLSNM